MSLASSVAPDKTTVGSLFNPLATGQLQHLRLGQARQRREVEWCRSPSVRHLDALLKTQALDLPRHELPEPPDGFGRVGKQIKLPGGVARHFNRADVDLVVDPIPLDLQLLSDLRYRQVAGNPSRVRLSMIDENAMTQTNVLHRARQDRCVARRTMTIQSQATCDLLVCFPLPGQRQDRLFHFLAAHAALQGAYGDRDRGVRRITSSPDDTAGDLIRSAATQDDLVDQTPQERLLLFP